MTTSSADNLIFIHGWATDAGVWDGVLPALTKDKAYLNISLPGHGGQSKWDEPTLEPARREVLEQMKGIKGRSIAIGWSLGGQVIISLASEHPDLFKAVVLIGATARFCADKDGSYGQSKALVRRMIIDMKKAPEEALKRFYGLNFTAHELTSPGAKSFMERYRYPGPVDCATTHPGCFPVLKYDEVTTALEALYTTDLTDSLDKIRARTLLIHGGMDSVCELKAGRTLASSINGARLEVFKDAGHAPFITEPDRFISCVNAFTGSL